MTTQPNTTSGVQLPKRAAQLLVAAATRLGRVVRRTLGLGERALSRIGLGDRLPQLTSGSRGNAAATSNQKAVEAPARKAPAKAVPPQKAAKKAPARKAPAEKALGKKAPAKAPVKEASAKAAPAKRAVKKSTAKPAKKTPGTTASGTDIESATPARSPAKSEPARKPDPSDSSDQRGGES